SLEQRVHLSLAHRQILQELQHRTHFVEGQPDAINEVGNLQDNLHAEFTAAQHAGNFAILVTGAAIDLVSDEHAPTVKQTPHGPRMRKMTILFGHTFGKAGLGAFGELDLVGAVESATPASP